MGPSEWAADGRAHCLTTVGHATVQRRSAFFSTTAIALVLFALAFAVAPRACEGGLEFYFWAGVVALIGLGALPFLARLGRSLPVRLGYGLGFALLGVGAWLSGLLAANVRIICRLF